MLPEEKDKLLTLFDGPTKWCQHVEAQNVQGEAVRYDDDDAIAWDLTGGICRLFGWERACKLFGQVAKQLNSATKRQTWPVRDQSMDAMKVLQEFNDGDGMSFDRLRSTLEAMPIWNAGSRVSAEVGDGVDGA